MSLKNRIFGFKTKDLYLLRYYVLQDVQYEAGDTILDSGYSYIIKPTGEYVLARKTHKAYEEPTFIDIFTGTTHNTKIDFPKNGQIISKPISPIIANKGRINYKDAQEILKTKNAVLIKE